MMQRPSRGAFILFEGVDRSGKTTQAKMLVKALTDMGKTAMFMRFPGMTVANVVFSFVS